MVFLGLVRGAPSRTNVFKEITLIGASNNMTLDDRQWRKFYRCFSDQPNIAWPATSPNLATYARIEINGSFICNNRICQQ